MSNSTEKCALNHSLGFIVSEHLTIRDFQLTEKMNFINFNEMHFTLAEEGNSMFTVVVVGRVQYNALGCVNNE